MKKALCPKCKSYESMDRWGAWLWQCKTCKCVYNPASCEECKEEVLAVLECKEEKVLELTYKKPHRRYKCARCKKNLVFPSQTYCLVCITKCPKVSKSK